MMRIAQLLFPTLLAGLAFVAPASAQEDIPFAGGTLRIEENADYEKLVTFDGQELARDYMAFFDRIADVGGTDVALVSIGPGGNACGANTLMIWRDDNGAMKTDRLPGDCGWPAPAVSDYRIVFLPWVGPGEELPVKAWTPENGFSMAGMLKFAPEPGSGWTDLAADPAIYPIDYFSNEAFFAYASGILGDDLAFYAQGLSVAAEAEEVADGVYAATGCVPHDCGGADSLIVVDTRGQKAWFAQRRDGKLVQWPDPAGWPAVTAGPLRALTGE